MKTLKLLAILFVSSQVWAQQSTDCNACAGGNTHGGYSEGCNYDQLQGDHVPPRNNSAWVEIFSENFSTNYVDQGDYVQYDNGWNASYHYTGHAIDLSCNKRANLSTDVMNGWVKLQTKYEPGTYCNTDDGDIYVDYTMVSLFPWDISAGRNMTFGPGKFEMRCWLPQISGQWPAFWLYQSDPDEPGHKQEIDIFEIKQDPILNYCEPAPACLIPDYSRSSNAATRMIMTTHYSQNDDDLQCAPQNCYINETPLSSGWHTFTLIWDEDIIEWFVDGNRVYSQSRFVYVSQANITSKNTTFPSAKIDMWLNIGSSIWTLNQANGAGVCTAPLAPNEWLIDYVKVWKRSCGTGNRILCFDGDPWTFFDPNDAIVKAQTIETSSSCTTWHVDNGQKLKLGATDEIKLVNFEAHLGSEFIATIDDCLDLEYRNQSSPSTTIHSSEVENKQENINKKLALFPNPNNGDFTLSIQSDFSNNTNLYMIDLSGRILHTESISIQKGANQIQLDKTDLPSGIYFIKIDGIDEPFKMIISK